MGIIKEKIMPDKKRTEEDIKQRQISDRSFKIWNPNGTLYAEMVEGKWIKRPESKKGKK